MNRHALASTHARTHARAHRSLRRSKHETSKYTQVHPPTNPAAAVCERQRRIYLNIESHIHLHHVLGGTVSFPRGSFMFVRRSLYFRSFLFCIEEYTDAGRLVATTQQFAAQIAAYNKQLDKQGESAFCPVYYCQARRGATGHGDVSGRPLKHLYLFGPTYSPRELRR